ncbi:MAG: D-alanyl-D-alanine carboxypeptidase family protein [Lachnospiraceae bacterium]|nr:D-alanyl-D-alanine carboxypeptidase family protein [Lachnospiraceae bacterium]
MKPLTYYIDRLITFVYVASLAGGVLVCTTINTDAADANKRIVNIRSVASTTDIDHMSADDFLLDTEKAADKEDLREYLDKLRRNGVNNNTSEDEDALDDEALWADEDVKEDTEDKTDKEKSEEIKIDPDDWHLMLVNKQNPVPEDYEVNLAKINGSMYVDERIIEDIYKMMDAASDDGVDLMICSAYRSYDRQRVLFNNKINKLMGQGLTYLESYKVGSMSVTVPGTSEHHLGLALDILTGSYTEMDDGFGETQAGKWLAANSADYGFILRYPKGKEDITGIIYEPWHFRYVGTEYAKDITERGVCLEEYLKGGL